jgi:hypothetical protein
VHFNSVLLLLEFVNLFEDNVLFLSQLLLLLFFEL